MPYINPATLIEDRFKSPFSRVLPLVPSLMADKRAKEQLGFQQEQEKSLAPYRQAQTDLATEKALEAKQARELYNKIMGGTGDVPAGITADQLIRHKLGVPQVPQPKQERVGNQVVTIPSTGTPSVQIIPGLQPNPPAEDVVPTQDQKTGLWYKSHRRLVQGQNGWEWAEIAKEPMPQILSPQEKIDQDVARQKALMPGDVDKAKQIKELPERNSASQVLNQMKVDAYSRHQAGNPTETDLVILGLHRDPNIAAIVNQVMQEVSLGLRDITTVEDKLRPPTAEEINQMIMTQIGQYQQAVKETYGGKSPMPMQGQPQQQQQPYQYTATNAQGQKIGWDGQKWVPIQQ